MNERDSEIISGMLLEKGYELTQDEPNADIILFNTCSVRQHAEDRVTGALHKLKSRKKNNPDLIIGVLGCMAQRHSEMLLKEFPQLDLIAGPSNIYDIPNLLEQTYGRGQVFAVDKDRRPKKNDIPDYRSGKLSAFVNIMYGCDNYCSYCIVPYVRGREVSRPKDDIVNEVKELAGVGVKEVVLLGQNVNSYGKGQTQKIDIGGLLEAVNDVKGIERIRFTSSHPKDATISMFKAMRDLDKVCEHLHLPLQSGSDKILDLMNRKYTYEEYKEKIDLLRNTIPEVGLSSDIIVGFPSEKEKDFNATCKAFEEIEYNSAFIFKYSPRPPAMASCLKDDVPEEIKKERNHFLLELQKKIAHKKNKLMIGSVQEVLVEGISRMNNKEVIGRIRNNTSCVFPGDDSLIGKLVNVEIKGTSPYTLKGVGVNR